MENFQLHMGTQTQTKQQQNKQKKTEAIVNNNKRTSGRVSPSLISSYSTEV